MKKLHVMFLSMMCLSLFSLFGAEQIVVPLQGLTALERTQVQRAIDAILDGIEQNREQEAKTLSKTPDKDLIIEVLRNAENGRNFQTILRENEKHLSDQDLQILRDDSALNPSFLQFLNVALQNRERARTSGALAAAVAATESANSIDKDLCPVCKNRDKCTCYGPSVSIIPLTGITLDYALIVTRAAVVDKRPDMIKELITKATFFKDGTQYEEPVRYTLNKQEGYSLLNSKRHIYKRQREFVNTFGPILSIKGLETIIAWMEDPKVEITKKQFFLECWKQFLKVRTGEIKEMPSQDLIYRLEKMHNAKPPKAKRKIVAAADDDDDE